ncbi:hypothetical protein SAMN05446037_101779 [Anaerovirgula multivorans]|uniref:Uncharacterized protein n=1 Tax=Anaerovirgula multivorans TaxID=312168 RepID=A0A239GNQ5_9FIRM|nr:hypothetical protein [Anaerovirgula multivorans]SNS70123.1 hypothetical protein SAMN05446037_101779 [Anaerovirgula multivorans]
MNQKVFMHVDETTTKVMESIQKELSIVIERKIIDIGNRLMNVYESVESINEEILNNSGDLERLKKSYKELKESVEIANNQLQAIQNGQDHMASIALVVKENLIKLQAVVDSSNIESIKAIENVLEQKKSLLEKNFSRNTEEILLLSNTVKHSNESIDLQIKSQGEKIKEMTNIVAINQNHNTRMIEMMDSIKIDGKTMNDSISITQDQLKDIISHIADLKSDVAYLKEPFFKRWFYKWKRGSI